MSDIRLVKLNGTERASVTAIYWGAIPLPVGHEVRGVALRRIGESMAVPAGLWTRAVGRNWLLAGGVVKGVR